jgi:hypothetical protein
LYSYLLKLKENIEPFIEAAEWNKSANKNLFNEDLPFCSDTIKLNAINRYIVRLKELIDKENLDQPRHNFNYSSLLKKDRLDLLDKIYENLTILHNQSKNKLLVQLNEFSEHFREQYRRVKKFTKHTTEHKTSELTNGRRFRVRQWSKEDPRTLNLGQYVQCCLAPTNTQFPAAVQRRMDAAMMFHVVEDDATNTPVALLGLYFGDADIDNIYLMANFAEVNTICGQDEDLRKVLLNALLFFTKVMYCKDNPGIKEFCFNQLTYGWNERDLLHHPLHTLKLVDKVGGAFQPIVCGETKVSIEKRAEITSSNYYLVSLLKTSFHLIQPQNILMQDRFIPLDELIISVVKQEVLNAMKNSQIYSKDLRLKIEPFLLKILESMVGKFFKDGIKDKTFLEIFDRAFVVASQVQLSAEEIGFQALLAIPLRPLELGSHQLAQLPTLWNAKDTGGAAPQHSAGAAAAAPQF